MEHRDVFLAVGAVWALYSTLITRLWEDWYSILSLFYMSLLQRKAKEGLTLTINAERENSITPSSFIQSIYRRMSSRAEQS
jgi:hypothetical protein